MPLTLVVFSYLWLGITTLQPSFSVSLYGDKETCKIAADNIFIRSKHVDSMIWFCIDHDGNIINEGEF